MLHPPRAAALSGRAFSQVRFLRVLLNFLAIEIIALATGRAHAFSVSVGSIISAVHDQRKTDRVGVEL
jgi:hypothetical protein